MGKRRDAGDQQQLHEERNLRPPEVSFDEDLAQSLASLPPLGDRYELQQEIMDARLSTRDNEGQVETFVSKAKLRHVITVDSVTRELTRTATQSTVQLSSEKIQSYARIVCTEAEDERQKGTTKITTFRKIFALLVLIEAVSSIVDFVREGVTDQDLPLVKHDGAGELYRKGGQICVPRGCFKEWSPLKLENFQRYQWWLLATYFSPPDDDGVVKNYKLQDQHILPFLTPGNALSQSIDKTGGYGKVIMVKIPSDHHNFSDTRLCERGFAVKQQVHDENRDAYKREIEILMKFSGGRSHPHIVSLLATYEQFNRFNLIFYRAEGDLFDYWKKLKPYPVLHHSNVNWFAKQCSGLVEGLSKLHKLLSFTKPQFKIEEEQVEYSYGGRELVKRFKRSRSMTDYFLRFTTIDTFYEVEKDPELPGIRAKVNPRVTAFIDELHRHPNCTLYLHEVLNLIQFDMLVVDSMERKSCMDVWHSLDALYDRCRRNADYATMSNPWCNMRRTASFVEQYVTSASAEAMQDDPPSPNSEAPAVQPIASRRRRLSRIPKLKSPLLA
ncbi:hypothetical protein J4E93_003504 [Alternaria ventricosa]|uniref:uncharacterized protein n=1 Tax=Alternaria ventricosa TaxID=1187951 RepID=UPI0020C295E5|nr:uncharacterized protein J4E93_003504 [Alternaria ventricosa]KAI4649190.1 hypothetical protein J4E93_003504 [Alternaria ventricosa]